MKYLIALLTLFIVSVMTALGQNQSEIDRLFKLYAGDGSNAKEIIISGDALPGTDMKSYHSLVLTDSPEEAEIIAADVNSCASKAIGREVERIGGQIYFAKYTLPPQKSDKYNRYLLYLNSHLKGGNSIKIIYIVKKGDLENIK